MPSTRNNHKLDHETAAALLRNAANVFSEALFLLDRSNRIILANNAAQRLTGLDEPNLIGQQINSILTIQDRQTRTRVDHLEIPETDLLVFRAKIHANYYTATFSPLTYIPYFAAFRPRATALAILSPSTPLQADHTTKSTIYLQLLGQLTMRIAHDFGNSLTSITGNAELIHEQISEALQTIQNDDPSRNLIRESLGQIKAILRKSREMAHFVTTLQQYAKQQPTHGESIELNHAISDTITMARHLLGRKIQIEFLPSDDLPPVYIDQLRIDQILFSILVHCKNAMPQGGRITILTDQLLLDEQFVATHPGSRTGNYTRLSITDSSAGMDQDTLNRIFHFPSQPPTAETSALALPTVYAIVKQFHAYIDVESWVGRGTRFDILLPQTPPPPQADTEADEILVLNLPTDRSQNILSKETTPTGSLILIAEDDTDICNFIKGYVTRAGYETKIATDGNAALNLYRTLTREGNQPALLIADLGLPGIDGKTLSYAIRHEYPGARILLTSGFPTEVDQKTKKTRDGFHFLQKPFPANLLLTTIDRIIKPTP